MSRTPRGLKCKWAERNSKTSHAKKSAPPDFREFLQDAKLTEKVLFYSF